MPLIPKPNYNQIFASQAPEQDKPAVFNNYPLGWGVESRPNNGKPTIKGFNYLQQTSDLKDLWILQNGACLPYDESIEYAEGAPVLKDGVIQYKTVSGFKSRDSVTIPTYNSAADGVDPVTGVADGAYFNVRSSSDESYVDEYQNVGGSAVATGKRYLSALGVQQQEKSASTIVDESGKTQQEINDAVVGRLLSSFGAVPNDPESASSNEAAIISAIQSGGDIIVDGFYYTTFSSTNIINSAFKLIAKQKGNGLYFTSSAGGGWLKLADIDFAILQGLDVRSSAELTGTLMIPNTDSTLIGEFGLIDCNYQTKIRAFYGLYTQTVNPAVTPYGIKKVSLLRNSCENVMGLFTTTDMPHDLLEVDGNRVRNMGATFINVSRGSTHAFPNELKASMKRAVFSNNTVINDDDYFVTGVGTYLTFALYEGVIAEKKFNWIESIKTRENAAVYDFYINSDELVSHKNTSKNNMCLNAQKTNNELMKAKGTYISRYSWDTCIVEKSFLQRHNALQDGMDWVTLYEKTNGDDNSNHIMEDCTVDVYAWLGLSSSTSTKGLIARRNTFIAEKAASNLFHINNIASGVTTYADAIVDVYGNVFKIKNLGGSITRNGQVYSGCAIMRMNYNPASGKGIYKFVGCHDNDFDIDEVTGISNLSVGIAAEDLNMGGNTFNVASADTDRFRFLYSPTKSVGSNNSLDNVIRVKTGYLQDFGLAATLSPDRMSSLSARVESAYRPWYTNIIASTSKNMFATASLRAISATGVWSATYNIKITPTGVEYTDVSDDVVKTASYPASGTLVINPKVVAVNASDALMAGVRIAIYPVGTAAGEISVNWRFDAISNGSPVKLDVDLDVFGY